MQTGIEISFELFPAKTAVGEKKLVGVWQALSRFNPAFFSVTFGAAGSTQSRTAETVFQLQEDLHAQNIHAVPHISCVGNDKATLKTILQDYADRGINRLVVLRGDIPSGMGNNIGDFQYACQLVKAIREWFGDAFHIDVAAYPEFHPQAENALMDLTRFKEKIDAGAHGAITQYFFCKEAYERLLESCQAHQINVPIVPGIMPIQNYQKLKQFSQVCGAEIPRWLDKRLEAFGDDQQAMQQYGIEVVTQLCDDLLKLGAPGLHFYTLNQENPTATICQQLLG